MYATPTHAFDGRIAKSGIPFKVKKFLNGDHYEYGELPGGKFYCRWKNVHLNSGLKTYKTRRGAVQKFEDEMSVHRWSEEQRRNLARITAAVKERNS